MDTFWSLNKENDQPLYQQIQDHFRKAIDEGSLAPGERLPSVSEMAQHYQVTQSTIRRALRELLEEGLMTSHVGRGTFVSYRETDRSSTMESLPALSESVRAARRLRQGITRSLGDLLSMGNQKGVIPFNKAVGDTSLLGEDYFADLVARTFKSRPTSYLETDDPRGLESLREMIARRYRKKGVHICRDQVLITAGSQQAFALLAQEAADQGWRILCETPGYMGVTSAFSAFGHWVETVKRDIEGPLPERLERFRDGRPTLLYLCPEIHNPMGTDISPLRREFIVNWLDDVPGLVVADEIFQDLRLDGTPPSSFLNDPGSDRAVIVSSLSKSFLSGLRIGWLVTSTERVRGLALLKKAMDGTSPPLMQGIALTLLESGEYDTHLIRIREIYRKRRDTLLGALEKELKGVVQWTIPQGGFQLWMTLPEGYSSTSLFLKAIENGVSFIPGPLQDLNHGFVNSLRLCYGSLEPQQIVEGIRRLAITIKDFLSTPPEESGWSGSGFYV